MRGHDDEIGTYLFCDLKDHLVYGPLADPVACVDRIGDVFLDEGSERAGGAFRQLLTGIFGQIHRDAHRQVRHHGEHVKGRPDGAAMFERHREGRPP